MQPACEELLIPDLLCPRDRSRDRSGISCVGNGVGMSSRRNPFAIRQLIPDPLEIGDVLCKMLALSDGSGIRCCDCGILTAIVQVAISEPRWESKVAN